MLKKLLLLITTLLTIATITACGAKAEPEPTANITGNKGGTTVYSDVPTKVTSISVTYTEGYAPVTYEVYWDIDEEVEVAYLASKFLFPFAGKAVLAPKILDDLSTWVDEYEIRKWDGFSLINEDIADASTITLEVKLESGETITANGHTDLLENFEAADKAFLEIINSYEEYQKLMTPENNNVSEVTDKAPTPWEFNVDTSWIDPEKPMVALSFDDGPVNPVGDSSPAIRIQNAISENGMHATFFYWGNSLNDVTVKELERAYELGFELGNHTKSHPDLSTLTAEKISAEVEFIDKKLNAITGQDKFLLRPPYLAVNDLVKQTIDVPLISCGLDSKDWAGATVEQMIETITKAAENGTLDGQIVLMHETYDTTAEAVEYLVPYLKEHDYQVVSISEMFSVRGKSMTSGTVYNNCGK